MVTALLVALLRFAAVASQDDVALTRVQALLTRADAMCGDFDQRKTLVGMQRAVRSSGRFCVLADRGVLWMTKLPFASTLRLTRDEITESQNERVTSRVTVKEEPGLGVINDLLLSVLAGDLKRLGASFTVTATVDGATWHARLVPKDAGMRRVIGMIDLGGGEFVRQVTITETAGDQTAITFAGIGTGRSVLQPDELRAFGSPARRTPSHQ